MKNLLTVSAVALLMGIAAQPAHANVIMGTLWVVDNATAQQATLANLNAQAAGSEDLTFTVDNVLDFRLGSGLGTINDWLASDAGVDDINDISTVGNQRMSDPTGNNALIAFTGKISVITGQDFSFVHDDGMTLIINGVNVIDAPGLTTERTDTGEWLGAAGVYDFTLIYGACCGNPSILEGELTAVPVPAALPIIGAALAGFGFAGWRQRKSAA